MKKRLLSAILSAGLFFAAAGSSFAVTRYQQSQARYLRHKRHMKTAKRVGIGAAGGAAIGALAGGGKGAAIGGIAGAGAGLLYDNHQKHRRYYQSPARYSRHRRRVNTAKRVGIGAAGGAAIGALAGGGKGAAIGGIAGAGAGALYDSHQKNRGRN